MKLAGNAFNIGGGFDNSISLLELIQWIEKKTGNEVRLGFSETRTGDQLYYISNTQKFYRAVGWEAHVSKKEGLEELFNWLEENEQVEPFSQKQIYV
jgi:CDP-paratose 2-epimerase